ncbi:Serine acetyltransferase [Olavius algarvensis spirochete endosymbiont]|uniref:serine O-acetyltransferase EpsC n=1 Tax=Olavius algarvensis spirochete endosymbiont TaxID=260710 RepID=UPI000F2A9AD3|nr:serine O-acetyltransferase EpsC [Olavius algarvensis spirochete endosymbiont]VDB00705.1 Serine acetyltransferase [Olavius algarvensis spirochete endosymbiont]
MTNRQVRRIAQINKDIVDSFSSVNQINRFAGPNLPSITIISNIFETFRHLIFPGFQYDGGVENEFQIRQSVQTLTQSLFLKLTAQITTCLDNKSGATAQELALNILQKIPILREKAAGDVEAAFRGDPAAKSRDEVMLSYPGLQAITCHRFAHEIQLADIPIIPRMLNELLHQNTGIDIHPGASIGDNFFIDHGTGVVIGETARIGENVKIYQGVTIGALSIRKELADKKRHPTIEDDVTIYAGATILGGKTHIGKGSVIGGNVWIINSLPPYSVVYNRKADYHIHSKYFDGSGPDFFSI